MQRCWNQDPCSRPRISEVGLQLLALSVCSRLIGHALAIHERISLIATIFLDNNRVRMVEHISGDDAQIVIDAIDEVSPCAISCSEDRLTLVQTLEFV